MFKEFLSKNSRSILIIAVLIGGWLILYLFNSDQTESLLNNPKKGQIYIFQEADFYAPMRLDSVGEAHVFMRNYEFLFSDAIPKKDQIQADEFDLNFYAIYEKVELKRLYESQNLIKIYP